MSKRLRLRRDDGKVYLNRWGLECSLGGIFLHKMEAADPGFWLHDHPWSFVSFILKGGYTEHRAHRSEGTSTFTYEYPSLNFRTPWSFKTLKLNECHRITGLAKKTSWSIIFHGPKVRQWGFFTDKGWVPGIDESNPERTVRNELAKS